MSTSPSRSTRCCRTRSPRRSSRSSTVPRGSGSPAAASRARSARPACRSTTPGSSWRPRCSGPRTASTAGSSRHRPTTMLDERQRTIWDAYAEARAAALGYPVRVQRRRYVFRLYGGFNDVADAEFERLWSGGTLDWAELEATAARLAEADTRPERRSRSAASRCARPARPEPCAGLLEVVGRDHVVEVEVGRAASRFVASVAIVTMISPLRCAAGRRRRPTSRPSGTGPVSTSTS